MVGGRETEFAPVLADTDPYWSVAVEVNNPGGSPGWDLWCTPVVRADINIIIPYDIPASCYNFNKLYNIIPLYLTVAFRHRVCPANDTSSTRCASGRFHGRALDLDARGHR